MGKICHIQIKVHEHIFLNPSVRYLDARNQNKFVLGSPVGFRGLIKHPRRQRHFILFEGLPQVLILGNLLFYSFDDLLRLYWGDRVRRCMLDMLLDFCFDQICHLFD